jgi:nucleoside-diphosphate-sugar epimerase
VRALVTGASGHLGAALVHTLLARGDRVGAMVRPASDPWRLEGVMDRVVLVRGGLDNPRAAAAAIREFAPEAVFHLAWWGVGRADRDAAQQVTRNVTGTLALFEVAREAGCRCFVGTGSQAEYGPAERVLTEDTPAAPVTAYGTAKLATGMLLHALGAATGVRTVWLRLLAAYGPADDEARLIPSTARALLARERPALSAGEQPWDYLYVDDAAEALRAAALSEAAGSYVLASGTWPTVREWVERVRDEVDPALPLGFGEVAAGPVPGLRGDPARFCRATGWSPRVGMDEGVRRTVSWLRSHRPR